MYDDILKNGKRDKFNWFKPFCKQVIVYESEGPSKAVGSHILQGMNEPVATTINPGGDTIVVIQNIDVENNDSQSATQPQHIIIKQVGSQGWQTTTADSNDSQPGQPNFNMGSVLSAIASHFKNSRKRAASEESPQVVTGLIDGQPVTVSVPSSIHNSLPSPSQDVIVSDIDNVVTETVSSSDYNQAKRIRTEMADSTQEMKTLVMAADGTMLQAFHTDQGLTVTQISAADSPQPEFTGPCPICTDRISGKALLKIIICQNGFEIRGC